MPDDRPYRCLYCETLLDEPETAFCDARCAREWHLIRDEEDREFALMTVDADLEADEEREYDA